VSDSAVRLLHTGLSLGDIVSSVTKAQQYSSQTFEHTSGEPVAVGSVSNAVKLRSERSNDQQRRCPPRQASSVLPPPCACCRASVGPSS